MKKTGEEKLRLDVLLVERGLFESREKAQAHILAAEIEVGGRIISAASEIVLRNAEIVVKGADRFASRGGEKLEGALTVFGISPSGMRAMDVGASTGGFTDCMLQHGAASVCAIDVGNGQIAVRLREDPRVTVRDRTNARNLRPEDFSHKFDFASIDVSFISLGKVLPAISALLESDGRIVALVKPQFEAGPKRVGRGGVVKDPETHFDVLRNAAEEAERCGLLPAAATFSPLKGPAGNIEFFLLLLAPDAARNTPRITEDEIRNVVASAHTTLDK